MPGCILHVSGTDFALDQVLATCCLKPYKVFRRGDVRRLGSEPLIDSGFKIVVSEANGFRLPQQVEDAIHFVSENERELSRFSGAGATNMTLDFGYYRRDVAVQTERLPTDLLRWCGELGINIELSLYAAPSDEDTSVAPSANTSAAFDV